MESVHEFRQLLKYTPAITALTEIRSGIPVKGEGKCSARSYNTMGKNVDPIPCMHTTVPFLSFFAFWGVSSEGFLLTVLCLASLFFNMSA